MTSYVFPYDVVGIPCHVTGDFLATWKCDKRWTEVDSCEIKVFWVHLLVAFRLFGAFCLLWQLYGFHCDGEFDVPFYIFCTPKPNAKLGSYRASNTFLITMATVVKETGPK